MKRTFVTLALAAGVCHAQKPTLTLYDIAHRPLVTCGLSADGLVVSRCSLADTVTVDDLVQRMLEQMSARQYAKVVPVRARKIKRAYKRVAARSNR